MTEDSAGPETLAGLLDELRTSLQRYVILPTESAYIAVTLWIAASHVQDAWEHAPRLVVKAPEKRCGKSRLLDIIEATCHAPLMAVHVSAASIYRAIGASGKPALTLLVDEADAIFGPKTAADNEDLRGLLNAGHQRNRRVPRWNANANKLELLETFAFAALAGIGDMPDTIEDRAVVVRMRRRMAGEEVDSFRQRRDAVPLNDLGQRLADHLREHLDRLQSAVPEMPVEDRAADTWEPLVAVAELAGEEWHKAARLAAVELTSSAAATTEPSPQLRLLADCRVVLAGQRGLSSTTLVEKLRGIEDSGWDTYGPTGLTPKRLSQLLRVYGIGPANDGKTIRWPDGHTTRGYFSVDFRDAWNRYLPPPATDAVGELPQPTQGQTDEHLPWSEAESACGTSEPCGTSSATPSGSATAPIRPLTSDDSPAVTRVADVSVTSPGLCRACGKRLAFDDGSHLHPTCEETP